MPQAEGKKCYACGKFGGVSVGRSSGDKDLFLGAKSRSAGGNKCEGSKSDWDTASCDVSCFKFTGKAFGEEGTGRGCLPQKQLDLFGGKEGECKDVDKNGLDGKLCSCKGDKCNKAASSGGPPLGMILLLGAVALAARLSL